MARSYLIATVHTSKQVWNFFIKIQLTDNNQFNYYFRSRLTEAAKQRLPAEYIDIYERVWDESDYVIPPSENNAFFVMTNVVLTPNQTRTTCPEDPGELPDVICGYKNNDTGEVNITQGVCVKGQYRGFL